MCDSKFNTIVAPTGSGKTITIEALIWNYLKNNPGHKTIITVPMNNIGYGYGENNFILNKEKISIKLSKRNLLINSKNNIDRLKSFIKEDIDDEDINNRILVCTHASLVKFYKELSSKEFKRHFSQCQLWIDESHHIQTIKKEDEYEFNRLSEVANACLDNNFSVNIITATFFRGDGHREFVTKEEFLKIVPPLKLKSRIAYVKWRNINERMDLPSEPDKKYNLTWYEVLGKRKYKITGVA